MRRTLLIYIVLTLYGFLFLFFLFKAITCEKPLINLRISPLSFVSESNENTYPIGSLIEFKCKAGYKLSAGGTSKAKCLKNGNWSSQLPTCESENKFFVFFLNPNI